MTLYLAPLGYNISIYIGFCKGSINLSHFKVPVRFNQSFFRNLKKVAVKIFRKNRLTNFYTRRKLVVNWLWCCQVINCLDDVILMLVLSNVSASFDSYSCLVKENGKMVGKWRAYIPQTFFFLPLVDEILSLLL